MNKPVILFGVSDLAKMLYTLSQNMEDLNVVAFMADDEYCSDTEFCGLPVWKSSTIDSEMTKKYDFLLCIGYKNMRNRKIIFDKLQEKGCNFINFIYPTAIILPGVQMGVNNIFLSNAKIENNVHIGDNNIFWSQSLICHDGIIGNHNFFAPRTTFAGNCEIGNLCFFGLTSFAINNLKISDETCLVALSGLFKNTEKSTRYNGNPAKKIDSHEKKGICI
jgi:sugar O-acyltransferase (sialic acid O-acetyltransferase NeuD family)